MARKAFTLTELLIGMAIMAVMAASVSLSARHYGIQTAKHEAERTAAYIQTHLRRADKTHDVLWLAVTSDKIEVKTGKDNAKAKLKSPSFEVRTGCSFAANVYLVCNAKSITINGRQYKEVSPYAAVNLSTSASTDSDKQTITVNGADGEKYYVIIGG